jgi:HK97 family phage prohead protease
MATQGSPIMEVKALASVDLKNEPAGEFDALVCTFGVPDKVGDVVLRGAFADTLTEARATHRKIPVVYSHVYRDPACIVGECDPHDVHETSRGLEAHGTLYLDLPNGKTVFEQLRRGVLAEWSFGFLITKARNLARGAREIAGIDLIEVGPCLRGLGTTATLATKAEDVKASLRASQQALVRERLAPHRARLDIFARRRQLADLAMRR